VLHLVEVQHIQLVVAKINNVASICLKFCFFLHRQFQGELSFEYLIHELNFDYAKNKIFHRFISYKSELTSSVQSDVVD
jgi:hypothetical protein